MMSGDNSADEFQKNRPVLGDITNRPGKRGLLLISGNSGIKSGDGVHKIVDDKEGDSEFANQVCLGVDNTVNEKCRSNCVVDDNQKGKRACVSPRSCTEINSLKGNIVSGISKICSEVKDSITDNVVEAGDASKHGCVSSISISTGSGSNATDSYDLEEKGNHDEGRETSKVAQSGPHSEHLDAHVSRSNSRDQGVDNLALSEYESVECSRLPMSQESRSFEFERCIGIKGDGSSNSSVGVDLIKACSCSFCKKVAYIWSDLHYQDMKGRLAALKKSQKEAGILVHRSCRDKGIDRHGQGNSNKFSKLESDLMGQWRSLFLHMEDILVRESSQLEASLLTLKDLRENCKTELEMIHVMPLEKQ